MQKLTFVNNTHANEVRTRSNSGNIVKSTVKTRSVFVCMGWITRLLSFDQIKEDFGLKCPSI